MGFWIREEIATVMRKVDFSVGTEILFLLRVPGVIQVVSVDSSENVGVQEVPLALTAVLSWEFLMAK